MRKPFTLATALWLRMRTSLIVSIWAIGGLQLLAIGVIGQYIGKVYLETKERPKYIVETYLSDENENSKEE